MLLDLLLTLNILVCLALIGVVLLQRSEGGALGGGGGPTGLVTPRGAGDLLTRATWVLFAMFLTISLTLTLLGGRERSSQAIIDRLKLQSINPDTLPGRPTASPTPPGQAAPPPVQTPGAGLAAPRPTISVPSGAPAPAALQTPPPAGSSFAAPAPVVSLPPVQATPAPPKR
jgi:preprotein translocase subunit SecG